MLQRGVMHVKEPQLYLFLSRVMDLVVGANEEHLITHKIAYFTRDSRSATPYFVTIATLGLFLVLSPLHP